MQCILLSKFRHRIYINLMASVRQIIATTHGRSIMRWYASLMMRWET